MERKTFFHKDFYSSFMNFNSFETSQRHRNKEINLDDLIDNEILISELNRAK